MDVMTRIVTEYEMRRRLAIANAQSALTDAMANHSLTPLEWCQVLSVMQGRMIQHGLKEEWADGKVAADGNDD